VGGTNQLSGVEGWSSQDTKEGEQARGTHFLSSAKVGGNQNIGIKQAKDTHSLSSVEEGQVRHQKIADGQGMLTTCQA
jgi:hypothetical protein